MNFLKRADISLLIGDKTLLRNRCYKCQLTLSISVTF